MEELNIVDENDQIIGKDTRENIHKNGLLHREIYVWIFNQKGEILFQRRAKTKKQCPDLLDASVGGHVEVGEEYLTAATRELEEETGLKAQAQNLIFLAKMKRSYVDVEAGINNKVFRQVYAYEFDGEANDLKIEKGAATSLEFWKIDKVLNLSQEDAAKFIPGIMDEKYKDIFRQIKKMGENSCKQKK